MPNYVDGYVIPVPTKNIAAYVRLAKKASKLWIEHGALAYTESVGDDLALKWGRTFTAATEAKKGETVVFAWIVFKSRAHRDRVNAAVMKDPRIAEMCDPKNSPFDAARMVVGGFKVAVSA
jgi:uncharacterized protein YbaA (DUF1428 family)